MSKKTKPSPPPLLIGLTGAIGSGKSTVAKIFEIMGAPIYDSDRQAKQLMQTSKSLKQKIAQAFGKDIYSDAGTLDRAKLAGIVFNDAEQLLRLNSLVHPAVATHFKEWISERQQYPILLKEAAILFESKADKGLHQIACVTAPRAVRLARVLKRDGVKESQFKAREDNQWPASLKAQKSHCIINNDGQHSLVKQAQNLWKYWNSSY